MAESNKEFVSFRRLEEYDGLLKEQELSKYTLKTVAGVSLGLSIDPITYVMTLDLKNYNGDVLDSKTVDFPIESMIVAAAFEDGYLILTLQNGTTAETDISAIVSGLVADSFTIAGIDMKEDITKEELLTALGLDDVVHVGDIKIGSVNLYNGTKDFSGEDWKIYNNASINTSEKFNDFAVNKLVHQYDSIYQEISAKTGDIFTYSVWVRSDNSCDIAIACNDKSVVQNLSFVTIGTSWKRISVTHEWENDVENIRFMVYMRNSGSVLYICGMQLEHGNIATDWHPSIKDLNNSEDISDGIEIGGRNLLTGTKDFGGDWINKGQCTFEETYNGFAVALRAGQYNPISQTVYLEAGKSYTLSAYICHPTGRISCVTKFTQNPVTDDPAVLSFVKGNIDFGSWFSYTEMTRVYATFLCTESGNSNFAFTSDTGGLRVCGFKLEQGSLPTDWTPAPEDMASKTELQTAIDDVEIGGRNYIINSQKKYEIVGKGKDVSTGLYVGNTKDVDTRNYLCEKTVTISFDYNFNDISEKYDTDGYVKVQILPGNIDIFTSENRSQNGISDSGRFTKTITLSDTISDNAHLLFVVGKFSSGKIFEISNIKVELGNKATDWSPSPEDIVPISMVEEQPRNIQETSESLTFSKNVKIVSNCIYTISDAHTNGSIQFTLQTDHVYLITACGMYAGTTNASAILYWGQFQRKVQALHDPHNLTITSVHTDTELRYDANVTLTYTLSSSDNLYVSITQLR